jgi:hypothetical protein
MSGPIGRVEGSFQPEELGPGGRESSTDAAIMSAVAADLERIAQEPSPRPSPGFSDRVGAVIAREPVPAPMAAAGRAVRGHSVTGFAAALRDAAKVGFGGRRPLTARAGALAMLAVAMMIVVSVGGALAFGAASIFVPAPPAVHPTEQATASPTTQVSPTVSSLPSAAIGTDEPTRGPGSSASESHGPGATRRETSSAGVSPKPGETPRPSESPHDSETPTASPTPRDSDGGH